MARFSVGAVFASTFRTVFSHFGTYFTTQGVFIIAGAAISLALSLFAMRAGASLAPPPGSVDPARMMNAMLPIMIVSFLASVLSSLLALMGFGAGMVVTEALQRGQHLTLGEAWARLRPRLLNLVATGVLVGLVFVAIMLAGMVLVFLIVPVALALAAVIYLAARWVVAGPAAVFETHSITGNLQRSSELTSGSRAAAAGLLALLFLVLMVPYALVILPLSLASMPDLATLLQQSEVTPTDFQPTLGLQLASWSVGLVFQLVGGFAFAALTVQLYERLRVEEPEPTTTAAPPPA